MNREKPAKDTSRLYIGNLDPTIDEYALVKLFEPFGKITLMDFLFHFAGPKRGQPRGYCFLEYSSKAEALKAIDTMNNKMIKGRPLIVSFALAAPAHEDSIPRKGPTSNSLHRPNLLSVMKTQKMANASTDAKIKAIEKKLASLQDAKKAEEPSKETLARSTNTNSSEALPSSSKNSNTKQRYKPY
ncbi:hypothetical protein BGW37DRAFT_503913 [Umbelopsis sp. PMI_123]|nr:hypothetical protein BGW37DRAFT_503913 [Umbelopsis sp. PMI_123]